MERKLVIANAAALSASQMTQFKSRVTLQFINGISRVLQKLLKYLNGTTIFTFANQQY